MRTKSALSTTGRFLSKAEILGVGAFSPLPKEGVLEKDPRLKTLSARTIRGPRENWEGANGMPAKGTGEKHPENTLKILRDTCNLEDRNLFK